PVRRPTAMTGSSGCAAAACLANRAVVSPGAYTATSCALSRVIPRSAIVQQGHVQVVRRFLDQSGRQGRCSPQAAPRPSDQNTNSRRNSPLLTGLSQAVTSFALQLWLPVDSAVS